MRTRASHFASPWTTVDSHYLELAYLEAKIWSLPKHENLATGKTYCGKEEKLLLRSNFSFFPQYFQYISNFKSLIHIYLLNVVNRIIFFLNSANLICRSTDISMYFRNLLEFEITRVDCTTISWGRVCPEYTAAYYVRYRHGRTTDSLGYC